MDYYRIADALNNAQLVFIDPESGIATVWHGGLTVNVFSVHDWKYFECFTLSECEDVNYIKERMVEFIREFRETNEEDT